MFLEDYHLHSKYSFDCQTELESIVISAEKKEIRNIAITDHVELACDFPGNMELTGNEPEKEIQEMQERFHGRVRIQKGMELGNAHLEMKKAIQIAQGFKGDFILGSVHNLVKNRDTNCYNFRKVNCDEFFKAYFNAVYDIALNADFDVLAHITYPLKAVYEQTNWKFETDRFRTQLEKIFRILVQREKGIEINTSGLRCSLNQLLPDYEILKIYRDCGGTIITTGSDAHEEQYVGEGIKEAVECLQKAGFSSVTLYEKRVPGQQPLEEKQ